MIVLSTTSMVAMLSVSDCESDRDYCLKQSLARRSGMLVSPYPKTNARAIESTTVAAFENPAAVPIAIPTISPIAHPVRQWRVAEIATLVSAPPSVGIS